MFIFTNKFEGSINNMKAHYILFYKICFILWIKFRNDV